MLLRCLTEEEVLSAEILGHKNKLSRMKTAQKVSPIENNYTPSETKRLRIITKTIICQISP